MLKSSLNLFEGSTVSLGGGWVTPFPLGVGAGTPLSSSQMRGPEGPLGRPRGLGGELAVIPLAALGPQELEGGGGRAQWKRQERKRGWDKGWVQVPKAPTFTPIGGHCQFALAAKVALHPSPPALEVQASSPAWLPGAARSGGRRLVGG